MGWATREFGRLTEEQSRLLARFDENPRVLVRGSAGTGKTVIAVEEASLAGDRVLYLCFHRLAASDRPARAVVYKNNSRDTKSATKLSESGRIHGVGRDHPHVNGRLVQFVLYFTKEPPSQSR